MDASRWLVRQPTETLHRMLDRDDITDEEVEVIEAELDRRDDEPAHEDSPALDLPSYGS